MKKITIKEYIINYAKNKYYFHLIDLRKYFAEKGIEYKEDSLKKSIYRLKKDKLIYKAGKGYYSTIEEEFVLDTKPVKKFTTLIKEQFPLLEFSCWSTEQLKGFFHHLPSQFVTFVYSDKDFLQSLKDFLTDNGYNVYLNPLKIEAEKYVEFKNQTIILRPSISYRVPKYQNFAKIEKILVDLFMEIQKIGFMDGKEFERIISNIIFAYRINMAELFDYAYSRKIKDKMQNKIMKLTMSTNATFL